MGLLGALQQVINGLGLRVDLISFLVAFGLVLTRVGTAISLAPFLGGKPVANNLKVGLGVMMTAVLLPGIKLDATAGSLNAVTFTALLVKEAMIGVTIGFLAQMIFYAVQMGGAVIDTGRGMDQPALVAPQLPGNLSILAQFKFQAAIVVFLFMNGHLIYLRALARSFDQLPLFTFPAMHTGSLATAEMVAKMSGQVFVIALQLSAPVMITLFLVDMCFGAIGKAAPQIHLHQESQPVKSFVGLLVLLLAIGFIVSRMESVLSRMMWNIYSVISGLS
jgi:flagellar biosynthetic protein FliR